TYALSKGRSRRVEHRHLPTTLPPNGIRKLRSGPHGARIRAVMYGLAGKVTPKSIHAPPPPHGKRYVGVRLGLQNLGTRLYRNTPAQTGWLIDRQGHRHLALTTLRKGLGTVALRKREALVGGLFFVVAKSARMRSFGFKPFGRSGPALTYALSKGRSRRVEHRHLPTTLPPNGIRKLRSGPHGARIRAVMYGLAGMATPKSIHAPPPPHGKRYVGVRLGWQNLGTRLYRNTPAQTGWLIDRQGHRHLALTTLRKGLGTVALRKREALVGGLFFVVAK